MTVPIHHAMKAARMSHEPSNKARQGEGAA